jgi:hypothetical protein
MDTVRAFEGKAARLESSMAGLEEALRLPTTSLRYWLGHMARMRVPCARERQGELALRCRSAPNESGRMSKALNYCRNGFPVLSTHEQ